MGISFPPEKKDGHIRIPGAFPGSGWAKICSGKTPEKNRVGGSPVASFPPLFWQTEVVLTVSLFRDRNIGFPGFSGRGGLETGLKSGVFTQRTFTLYGAGFADGIRTLNV